MKKGSAGRRKVLSLVRRLVITLVLTGLISLLVWQFVGESDDSSDVVRISMTKNAEPTIAGTAEEFCREVVGVGVSNDSGERGSWFWFLVGAWISVALFFVISIYSELKRK